MFTNFVFLILFLKSFECRVPPAACLAKPRWEDCGKAPTAVMYYYKPGSRCEVGFWRGCYPNLNMFKDEFECVSTCIFGSRAESEDYHKLPSDIYEQEIEVNNAPDNKNSSDSEEGDKTPKDEDNETQTINETTSLDPTDTNSPTSPDDKLTTERPNTTNETG